MNTDKLLKAIRILIREEIKSFLPKLVKEVVKREVNKAEKRILKESKGSTIPQSSPVQSSQKDQLDEEVEDPFDKAEKALLNHREEEKRFSKNPMINKVLNETASQYNPGEMSSGEYDSTKQPETSERTMNFNSSDVGKFGKANMASQLGYGEFSKQPPIPTKTHTGKTVDVNDPTAQPVIKALTRDYSELMKHINKKK